MEKIYYNHYWKAVGKTTEEVAKDLENKLSYRHWGEKVIHLHPMADNTYKAITLDSRDRIHGYTIHTLIIGA